jgi:hypothetical protein
MGIVVVNVIVKITSMGNKFSHDAAKVVGTMNPQPHIRFFSRLNLGLRTPLKCSMTLLQVKKGRVVFGLVNGMRQSKLPHGFSGVKRNQIRNFKNWLRGVHSYCNSRNITEYINEYFIRFNRRNHRNHGKSILCKLIGRMAKHKHLPYSSLKIIET